MEKDLTENKVEGLDLENESTELSENRHETAEKSGSFPPQKKSNAPPSDGVESETPPSSEEDKNNKEPSPLEGRVAELEQKLERAETQRREGEEQLSTTQKSLAEAVSRYRALLLTSTPEAPESMVVGETVDEVDRSFAEAKGPGAAGAARRGGKAGQGASAGRFPHPRPRKFLFPVVHGEDKGSPVRPVKAVGISALPVISSPCRLPF